MKRLLVLLALSAALAGGFAFWRHCGAPCPAKASGQTPAAASVPQPERKVFAHFMGCWPAANGALPDSFKNDAAQTPAGRFAKARKNGYDAVGGRIVLSTALESSAYVEMTLRTLRRFGVAAETLPDGWRLAGGQSYGSPGEASVEGDWSNAAGFLCAGALGGPLTLTGLDHGSAQGDRRIVGLLRGFGARVEERDGQVTVSRGELRPQSVDMSEIPDLLPVLSAFAAAVPGRTVLCHAERVRLKECDRVAAMAAMLRSAGCPVEERPDGLAIDGGGPLRGGPVEVCNDHRLVMAAALLAVVAGQAVSVSEAGAVAKSYPEFVSDWQRCQSRRG